MQSDFDIECLRQFAPLDTLSEERLYQLYTLASVERFSRGDEVLGREPLSDQSTMYLLSGKLAVEGTTEGSRRVVSASSPASRLPVAGKATPALSARARSDVEVLRIDAQVMEYLLDWDRYAVADAGVDSGAPPGASPHMGDVSTEVIPFSRLPGAVRRELLERMETVRVSTGDVVVRQGDPGDYYYVLAEGQACVTRHVELADLGAGTSFGEEALLSEQPRNATVTMSSDGTLHRISRQDFQRLLGETLIRHIDVREARDLVNEGAIWLDVRSAGSYARAHLPDAINLPLRELRERMSELIAGYTFICYCDDGSQSASAAFLLRQHGYESYVLKGGYQALPRVMRAAV